MNTFRDNGGKLPTGLNYVKNTSGRPILIWPFNKKRQPIVKLRKERQGVFEGLWKWKCRQCSNTWGTSGIWEYAINDGHTHAIMTHALPEYIATYHARNHH